MSKKVLLPSLRFAASVFCLVSPLYAQQPPGAASVDVVIKPGHAYGNAVAQVAGKPQTVTHRAVKAWVAEEGNSVVVVAPPESHHPLPQLRIFDVESGQRHTLGDLPLSNPEFLEIRNENDPPVFLLKGEENGQPMIYLADRVAIHTRIPGASAATLTAGTLTYTKGGQQHSLPVATALASDLTNNIYSSGERKIQILSDGSALLLAADNKPQPATWLTDGENIYLRSGTHTTTVTRSTLQVETGVPAHTRLTLRLLSPLDSRKAKAGQKIDAALILPAVIDGKLYLPQNTTFQGTIVKAHGVHYGLGHETAAVTLHFDHAVIPNGPTIPISASIVQVENARESVDSKGAIKGQRATGTLGHSAEGKIVGMAQVDPIAWIGLEASGTAIFGFAESEILFPAGTEMIARLDTPLVTTATYPNSIGLLATSQQAELTPFLQSLPYRTTTQVGDHPSDMTSIVFLGDPDALKRAFAAAGWVTADSLTAASTFSTIRSVSGTQNYNEAPMSTLLLDNKEPITTLTKTTNTFNSRHHLRVFPTGRTFDGEPVLTASTTQDVGIAFSRKKKTFIHVIDQYIDNERAKVINDLVFTRCVDAVQMVPRSWVPLDAYNSTGDRLRTDGKVAVLRLNSCAAPVTTTPIPAKRPNLFERSIRNTLLTLRNDFYRGNLVYQGIDFSLRGHSYFAEHDAPANLGSWYMTEASSSTEEAQNYGLPQTHNAQTALNEKDPTPPSSHRWDPPRYEIGFHGGYMRYRNPELEQVGIIAISSVPTNPFFILGLGDEVGDGWTAGFSVTVNSWNYVSNEFSYFRQQGKYRLNAFFIGGYPTAVSEDDLAYDSATETVGLVTRQFEYNTLVHFSPRKSRFRPYIAAGPVLQLIALADAPLKKPSGLYNLGLKNLGLFMAAFDFGRTPPLDGGGIFQPGLQYGAGFKYRVHPRIMLRLDWRETWSRNPSIIRASYDDFDSTDLDQTYETEIIDIKPETKFFQQRATAGIAFTF